MEGPIPGPGEIPGNELHAKIKIDHMKDYIDQADFADEGEAQMDQVYRFGEVIPEDRNFDIRVRDIGDKHGFVDLVLVRDDGAEVSLSELLPKGYRFKPGSAYMVNILTKVVYFEYDNLDFREAILSIAHEIGHAKMKAEGTHKKGVNVIDLARGMIESVMMAHKIRSGEQDRKEHMVVESRRELLKRYDGMIPDWFLEKVHRPQASNERGAWAESLTILRGLENEGYEVFSGFDSVKDVFAFIKRCLLSYEMRHEQQHYFSGNDDSYEPLFEKRHRRLRPDTEDQN